MDDTTQGKEDKSLLELKGKELHKKLKKAFKDYHTMLEERGIMELLKKSWQQYYAGFDRGGRLKKKTNKEEGSQLLSISVNEYSAILRNLHTLITKDPPYIDAKPIAMNHNAIAESVPAKTILEYYQTIGGLDKEIEKAKLWELLLGTAYVHISWDDTKGKLIATNKDGEAFAGDIEFRAFMPTDVARPFYQTKSNDWRITRELVAKNTVKKIYQKKCSRFLTKKYLGELLNDEEETDNSKEMKDLIDVYSFYHAPNHGYPRGYRMKFTAQHILEEDFLDTQELPLIEMTHESLANTCIGNSVAFDLLELQKAKDSLVSTAITNQANFGVNALFVPKSAQIQKTDIGKAAKVYEVNSPEDMPTSLNLLNTSPEIFQMERLLNSSMEKISGVNAVMRGDARASQSGQALALMTSMAVQSSSGYVRSFRRAYKQAGEKILALLHSNLDTPREYGLMNRKGDAVVGKVSKNQIAEKYNVKVELESPIKTTAHGRIMLAESLLNRQLIKPKNYIDVLLHGRVEGIMDEETKIEQGLRAERAKLITGEEIDVIELQDHAAYIQHDQKMLEDPDIVKQSDVVKRVFNIIEKRLAAWKEVSINNEDALLVLGFPLHPEVAKQKQLEEMQVMQAPAEPQPPPAGLSQTEGQPPVDTPAGAGMPPLPNDPTTGRPPEIPPPLG